MNLKRKLIRYLCLHRHSSSIPTGLEPLSKLRSVVIFMDKADEITEPQKIKIRGFFKEYGLSTSFLYMDNDDLRSSSDMFISLSLEGGINERYAASASTARFKVGRHQLEHDIYDLVVTDSDPEHPCAPLDALTAIEHYLVNIQ